MVSSLRTRPGVWIPIDGIAIGRRDLSPAGGADPGSLRVACVLLRVRRFGGYLEYCLVRLVSRFSRGNGRHPASGIGGDSRLASPGPPWRSVEDDHLVRKLVGHYGRGFLLYLQL